MMLKWGVNVHGGRGFVVAAGLVVASCIPAWAQTNPQRGVVPNGFYQISQIETIDAVGGSATIHIPLASLPPGPGASGFSLDLIYNSAIYHKFTYNGDIYVVGGGGWNYSFAYSVEANFVNPTYLDGGDVCEPGVANFFAVMPDGSSHPLYLLTPPAGNGVGPYYSYGCGYLPFGTFYTADGTYLRVSLDSSENWTMYLPDGHTVTGNESTTTSITDRNGNAIQFIYSGTTVTLQDTPGRTISLTYGPGGQTRAADTIQVTGYGGQAYSTTVNWEPYTIPSSGHTYECIPGDTTDLCNGWGYSSQVVSSISLPTGLSYQFQYDTTVGWGQLSQMTLPTGAYVNYTYDNDWDYPHYSSGFIATKSLNWTDEDAGIPRVENSSYAFTAGSSTFTNPDGGVTTHLYNDATAFGPLTGLVYSVTQPDGDVQEQVWGLNVAYNTPGSQCSGCGNPYVQTRLNSVANGGSPAITSVAILGVDRNGNQTQEIDCDYVSYSSVPHNQTAITSCPGATLRTIQNTYTVPATSSPGSSSNDPNGYWQAPLPQILNLVARTTATGAGPGSATEFQYDGYGNLKQQLSWDSTLGALTTPLSPCTQQEGIPSGCNAAQVTHSYDGHGNVTSTTDADGDQTALTYDSQGLCLTAKTLGSGARHFTYMPCDQSTSLMTSETDTDHGITRTFGYDKYGRNTSFSESGGGITRGRTTNYNDSGRIITVNSDLNSAGDGAQVQTTWYDQLGRVRQTQDAAGNVAQSEYYTPQSLGLSYVLSSNPYASGAAPSGWTLTQMDTVGRTTAVQHCSSGSLPFQSTGGVSCSSTGTQNASYGTGTTAAGASAAMVTSQDEALVTRTNFSDGLGRLTQVTENGTENSGYSYDALGNLTATSVPGEAARSFSYSSLARLISASNPESALSCYSYDEDGNLWTRKYGAATCPNTGAGTGGVTTGFTYDSLNQLRTKTYDDGTAAVNYTYTYDWPTSTTSGPNTTQNISFDGLGRVTQSSQTTNGTTYTFSNYQYNLADSVTSITYPSGRTIATTYDNADRPIQVQGTATTYASSVTYAPQGAVSGMKLGNGLWASIGFNNQLQATSMGLGTSQGASNIWSLTNNYSGTRDNGNIAGQTLVVPGTGTVNTSYGYDGVNRLSVAAENSSSPSSPPCPDAASSWCRGYNYYAGGHANRRTLTYSGQGLSPLEPASFNSNNQIADSGWQYTRGNVTADKIGDTITYDAENRQTSFCTSGGCTYYTYDGNGLRVMSEGPGGGTVFVYDAAGNLTAEYDAQPPPSVCTTCYVTTDHLGSTRVVTDASGCAVYRQDYLPFGETILTSTGSPRMNATGGSICATNGYLASSAPLPEQFTGQEFDTESNLNFFQARYFSGAEGRFGSPDPDNIGADPTSPQSWNMYSYVLNNPVANTDPDGTCTVVNGQYQPDVAGGCPPQPSSSVTVDGGSTDDAPLFLSVVYAFGNQASRFAVNLTDTALTAISNFRNNPNCAAGLTLGGAAFGAGVGAYVGGATGGAAGFVGGSVVPVAGNAAGLAGGAALGSTGGALAGGSLGGALGGLAGSIFCSGGGGAGGANPNKLKHVFQPKHKLGPLVEQFGNEDAAFKAISDAAEEQLTGKGVANGARATVQVGDQSVVVTGYNSPSGFVVGNAWIP